MQIITFSFIFVPSKIGYLPRSKIMIHSTVPQYGMTVHASIDYTRYPCPLTKYVHLVSLAFSLCCTHTDSAGHILLPSSQAKPTMADFKMIRRLGEGSYSIVVLAMDKRTGNDVALKIVDKQFVVRHNMAEYIKQERDILLQLEHPGICRLEFTFRDNTNVCK